MMYQDKFVATVKCNNKIMRERNGIIFLPFESEYSILLKNLNTVKACVDISIDGKNVLDGQSLLIKPGSSTELEGFMNGMVAKNKFKFINKTKEISDYRGDRIDDGLIRVEFRFEQKIECKTRCIDEYNYYPIYSMNNSGTVEPYFSSFECNMGSERTRNYVHSSSVESKPLLDEGITVKGSSCDQEFRPGYINVLEQNSSVIIIQLKGHTSEGIEIKKPITVDTKIICETCGLVSKSNMKFCGNCGTSLI